MGTAFHERLRQEFLAIAASEPSRCCVIDAARGLDDVARDVESTVLKRLSS
jgi:dTMP kinase